MIFSRGKLLIIPDSPDVLVYGSPREALHAEISGRIVYTTNIPRPVSSLIVRFRPKNEELFNPAMSVACQSEISSVIVKDGISATTATELPFNEAAGQQEWRFSMSIPGNISETVFTPTAFIAYELVAEIRIGSITHWSPFCKQVSSIPMTVKRVPAPGSLWASVAEEPMDISAIWQGKLELSAVASSRIAYDSQPFCIRGVIRPLTKGMRLLRTTFDIREAVDGPFDSGNEPSSRSHIASRCTHDLCAESSAACQDGMRVVVPFPHDTATRRRPGLVIDQEIQISGSLNVPRAYEDIQYDIAVGPIRVSHVLFFSAAIADERGQVHTVRLSSGVYVLPRTAVDTAVLPRYEHSDKDVLLAAGQRWSLRNSDTQLEDTVERLCCQQHHQGDNSPPAYECVDLYISRPMQSAVYVGCGVAAQP
ncbi:hypothetical protein H4R24_002079 [Coemansia sp. RSA 988]|nr:hypothetical protein H4R24_002079 [Coemansia sp. RSA 988]